jgi:hypothetical protein
VRNTAAEESLDHQSLHYEARLNSECKTYWNRLQLTLFNLAQEKLIQELTSQLARVEPLARSGKTSLLHFLTRDAADQEQRGLENEVNRWKDIAKAKDAIIAEKDKRITELERAGSSYHAFFDHTCGCKLFCIALQSEMLATNSMRRSNGLKLSRPKLSGLSPLGLRLVDVSVAVGSLVLTTQKMRPSSNFMRI